MSVFSAPDKKRPGGGPIFGQIAAALAIRRRCV
jgi:hypothetical protein